MADRRFCSHAKRFLDWAAAPDTPSLRTLTADDVAAYVHQLIAQGLTGTALLGHRPALRLWWAWRSALVSDRLDIDPADAVVRLPAGSVLRRMVQTLGLWCWCLERFGLHAPSGRGHMRYQILGSLEVLAGHGPVEITAPKHRTMLAVLLVNANQIVSTERLIAHLWGEQVPATPTNLVRVYVSQLRRLLQPGRRAGIEPLSTRPAGYLLKVAADEFDLYEFERLVVSAEAATAAGKVDKAAAELSAALSLWRGPALADVSSDLLTQIDIPRLEEQRMMALEARIDADLLLGRHRQLVGELRTLATMHPLRERLHAHLMLALYRSGRRADALQAYQQVRRDLVQQLGLEPEPELQALQGAILADDPSLQPPVRQGVAVTTRAPDPPGPVRRQEDGLPPRRHVPMQLPAGIADFTGRSEAIAHLERMLVCAVDGRAAAVPVVAVAGKAGVGKTAMAVRAAHRLRDHFPDGQLYVDLRGAEGRQLDPAAVLGEFLAALGVDLAAIPPRLDERARTYRSVLASRRTLIVLDNAGSEVQVRPLLPGSAGCAAIITSRSQLVGLESAHSLVLDVFEPEHASELLGRLAGRQRLQGEPEAAAAICRLCGQLPLAVRIAGARLAAKPHWTLAQYAERLADEHRRLGELVAGDLEVRSSVALSYQGLGMPERRALRLLGLVDASDFAAWVLAPLLDGDAEGAEDLVERLADAQLLEVAGRDAAGQLRYRFHDLLRVFARERLREEESEAARSQACARLFDAAITLAASADALLGPGRRGRGPLEPSPRWQRLLRTVARQLERDPRAWLSAERVQLVAMVAQARQARAWAATWRLAGTLAAFLEQRDLLDWQRVQELAVAAGREGGDPLEEAWSLRDLGDALWRTRSAAAQAHLDSALALFRQLGDLRGEAYALRGIGDIQGDNSRFEAGDAALSLALARFSELGDRYGEAKTLLALGQMLVRRRPGDAVEHLERCLPALRESDDRQAAADAHLALGASFYHRALVEQATDHFMQARRLYLEVADATGEAYVQLMLGRTLLLQRRGGEATVVAERALATARERADRYLEATAMHCLADCRRQDGRFDEAIALYEDSLALVAEIGDREGKAHCYRGLGNAARGAGRDDQALSLLRRAVDLFDALDIPRGAGPALQDLGDLYRQLDRLEDAAACYRQAITMFDQLEHRAGLISARERLAGLPGQA